MVEVEIGGDGISHPFSAPFVVSSRSPASIPPSSPSSPTSPSSPSSLSFPSSPSSSSSSSPSSPSSSSSSSSPSSPSFSTTLVPLSLIFKEIDLSDVLAEDIPWLRYCDSIEFGGEIALGLE